MTLEDFEKELMREKDAARQQEGSKEESKHRHRHHRSDRHHHHKQRNSSRSRERDSKYDEDGHRSKRSRRPSGSEDRHADDRKRSHKSHHGESTRRRRDSDEETKSNAKDDGLTEDAPLKRDAWMQAPSALDVDYIHRPQQPASPPKNGSLEAQYELKLHEKELNHHLRDLKQGMTLEELETEDASHEVDYMFGDSGSHWRMTKLKAVYREAKEKGESIEAVAAERFGDLRSFDDAREEELELDRRQRYGEGYVGKIKPSGELFQERKLKAGIHRKDQQRLQQEQPPEDVVEGIAGPSNEPTPPARIDQTQLNKLKAQLLRAKMSKDPKAAQLEEEYNEAISKSESQDSNTITLSAMDNRMLATAPRNEVKPSTGRRALERGNVESNDDMSIEDMLREERRSRRGDDGTTNEAQQFASRIAKDAKFTNDLEYLDENAGKLAKRTHQSSSNLRNVAISSYQKLDRILVNCPLCHHEDTNKPPLAPIISLATRTYLTLPTLPALSDDSTLIVPTTHHTNLLHCDDDEWEEIRNFMKSLTRLYHAQGRAVLFYENAAFPGRHPHAAMAVVPVPYEFGDTAPAFFKEAVLAQADEWSQHRKIIDTLANATKNGMGKLSFRRSLVKEMPYFHVWFAIDGGLGHVVEDEGRWPRGDLFAREVIGGMLDLGAEVVKRQGRWTGGHEERERAEAFRKIWRKFDWTRVLTEGG